MKKLKNFFKLFYTYSKLHSQWYWQNKKIPPKLVGTYFKSLLLEYVITGVLTIFVIFLLAQFGIIAAGAAAIIFITTGIVTYHWSEK